MHKGRTRGGERRPKAAGKPIRAVHRLAPVDGVASTGEGLSVGTKKG